MLDQSGLPPVSDESMMNVKHTFETCLVLPLLLLPTAVYAKALFLA